MKQTKAIAERDLGVLDQLTIAREALSTVQSLPALKDLRDKVEAIGRYTKQRDYSLEIQNSAAEIRLKAERRLGELLREQEKDQGGRPKKNSSHDGSGFPTLEELGIDRHHSSRWQQEAALPEDAFQTYVTETKAKGEELTSAAVLRQAKAYLPPRTTHTPAWCLEDDVEVLFDVWGRLWPHWQTRADKARISGMLRGFLAELETSPDDNTEAL